MNANTRESMKIDANSIKNKDPYIDITSEKNHNKNPSKNKKVK